jgi:hypothetical protein
MVVVAPGEPAASPVLGFFCAQTGSAERHNRAIESVALPPGVVVLIKIL